MQIKPCNYQLVIKINIDNVILAGICLGRTKNTSMVNKPAPFRVKYVHFVSTRVTV